VIEGHLQRTNIIVDDNKDLKLFRAFSSNPEKSFTEIELLAITGSTGTALRVLKSRLFDKIKEALTHDTNILNEDLFNEIDRTIFKLTKDFLFFRISIRSHTEKKTEALAVLLDQIIATAKTFELYDILTETLAAKKYVTGIRSNVDEFNRINGEIIFYADCLKALRYAGDCYYRIIINNELTKSLSEKEMNAHIQSSIKQLQIDFKRTNSQQINYYLQILLFAHSEKQKNYPLAIKQCNHLIVLLKSSKAVYRKERIGHALLNLSQFKVFIGDYFSAAKNAEKARDYYLANSFDNLMATEQEFYAHFYNKTFETAHKCVNRLLEHTDIDAGAFRKAKFIYYQACISFATGAFQKAFLLLSKPLEIEKDKSRWNISLRILNIQLFIELNKIKQASHSLDALRKFIKRLEVKEEIKPRDILIVKLLREIEKDGFLFNSSNALAAKMLKELSQKDSPVSWEHYSSELIPVHEWLESGKRA
jgi:tetratricopeptide (TPR) repeat protein